MSTIDRSPPLLRYPEDDFLPKISNTLLQIDKNKIFDVHQYREEDLILFLNSLKIINKSKNEKTSYIENYKTVSKHNFIVLYKELSKLSPKQKNKFISDIIGLLNISNKLQNQELLKKEIKSTLNKIHIINFISEPLYNQLNINIGNIIFEEDDSEDELTF